MEQKNKEFQELKEWIALKGGEVMKKYITLFVCAVCLTALSACSSFPRFECPADIDNIPVCKTIEPANSLMANLANNGSNQL